MSAPGCAEDELRRNASAVRSLVGWAVWSAATRLVRVAGRLLDEAPLGLIADEIGEAMGKMPYSASVPVILVGEPAPARPGRRSLRVVR